MDLMSYVPHFSDSPKVERNPILAHKCARPQEPDEWMNFKRGDQIWTKLCRWFVKQRILSKTHPLTRWCLKSTTAVNFEISRHLKSHPYMIHPFSTFRTVWETFILVFTFGALLVVPFTTTFYYEMHKDWHLTNITITLVFLSDVIMWFFTGYYDYRTKVIALDPVIVARKYFRSYFLIDLVTALPLGYMDLILPSTVWYCTTLNMIKIFRVRNCIVYFSRLRHVYCKSFRAQKIIKTTALFIICIHWTVCLEYYVPFSVLVLGTLSNNSWINSGYFKNKKTVPKKYLACLNRGLIALLRSGHYLDMKTPEDIILNMILTSIGFIGFIFLLTQLCQLVTTFHMTDKRQLIAMKQLQEYMRYKELPQSMQHRLSTYYHYRNKMGFERDKKIINELSPYLREELILHCYSRLINNVELFKHMPKAVVAQLAEKFRCEIYMAGDEIVKAGTAGDALYFLSSGTVAVYTPMGKEICHLKNGSYFGEIALVMDTEHRIATVIAAEISQIYVLRRDDFRLLILPYPDLLNRLQNVALEHLKQSLLLEAAEVLAVSSSPRYVNISSIRSKKL